MRIAPRIALGEQRRREIAFLFSVLIAVTTIPVAAQNARPEIRLAPALIGESTPTPGVRGTLAWSAKHEPSDLTGRLRIDVPLTLDPDKNPESLEAALSVSTLILDLSGADLTGAPGAEPPDRGAVRLGIRAGAEGPQRLGNVDLGLGLTALYDHASPALWYVPGIDLGYDVVRCVGCDPGDDDNLYHRMDLRVDWSVRLDALTSDGLDGFRLRPSARWFRAWGVGPDLSAFRNDTGLWGRIQLAYHTEIAWLHEVYVSWRGGDLPVRLQEKRAWSAGVTVVL